MMRVLDLDLDFFLADCCPLADEGERPAVSGREPWPADAVRDFLERQCGLSKARPVPGRIFPTHDGALTFWAERMAAGKLSAPFSVTHVDAHSDLGIGKPGPGFVLQSVLPLPPARRADIPRYYEMRQLDEANYLLFALAFRWVGRLENVRNPRSRRDLPMALPAPGRTDALQLSSFVSRLMEAKNGPEPVIPYAVFDDYTTFRSDAPYDYVTLAVSPRYAPKEADALLPVIGAYLRAV